MKPRCSSENGNRIYVEVGVIPLRLVRDLKGVTHGCLVRRSGGRALAPVLTLDKAVCDPQDGVDDDSIDAFGDLVLFTSVVVSLWI